LRADLLRVLTILRISGSSSKAIILTTILLLRERDILLYIIIGLKNISFVGCCFLLPLIIMTRKMPKNLKQSQKTAKQLRKEIATWKKANTPGKIPSKKKDMINYIQRNNI